MKKTIYLDSKGSVCRLTGTNSVIEEIIEDDFTKHFIPDLRIRLKYKDPAINVIAKEIKVPTMISYPNVTYKPNLPPRDIVSLCEYLLERNRQEKKGYYSLSSATASRNGDSVIFFAGATNSGKTSGMLDLIQNHGFSFYSDEHTLIDLENKKVVGGSRSIATRKEILKKRLSNVGEFLLKDLDDDYEKKARLFIYPHIDHGLDKPIQYQFSPLDFHWLLSREFGGVIRGVVKFTDHFRYPLPSLDTRKLSKIRAHRTQQFANFVPCYYFQGSLSQMSNFVEEKLKEND
ncbi:MAG: hypothetical protein WC494_03270 [Candidatus Pacearchaeota archaeon]